MAESKNPLIEAADLFCGAGGLTYGLQQNPEIRVVVGVDLDDTCVYPFENNNKSVFLLKNIENVKGHELTKDFSSSTFKLLAGCAPCQPFSTFRNGKDNKSDAKWGLLDHFKRLVEEMKPDLITMENVPQLRKTDVFQRFVSHLDKLKYHVQVQVVYCPSLGIPQHRKRLVLMASRFGPISKLVSTHEEGKYPTVRTVIGKLPKLFAGGVSEKDPLHRARKLTPINATRIKQSIPGGTWQDWPKELRAKCHQRETGLSFKSVYARMEWDKPAPTITTQCYNFGAGRFGHPKEDRAISLREAALLQTFPEGYRFAKNEDITFSVVGRMIGNAVPPRLGQVIGKHLLNHLKKYQQEKTHSNEQV